MEFVYKGTRIVLTQGDITTIQADAIVNAANSSLMGGGGVDGAIHKKGGPQILEACKTWVDANGQLPTGEAMLTSGGNLPAANVIHTVGPVYQGGTQGEYVKLERAYASSLAVAVEHGLKTIAFPSISTGAYRFPIDDAALVALNTIKRFIGENEGALDSVTLVLFSGQDFAVYAGAFDEVITTMMG